MKLSELIKQLQEIEKEQGGDIECYVTSSTSVGEQTLEIMFVQLQIDNHGKFVDIN